MSHPEKEPIVLSRDCDAVLIPAGTNIRLMQGSVVFITQALGGNYTVNINGNLAQVNARDADALGFNTDEADCRPAERMGGKVTEDAVWERLRTCYDPEIPVNMVDLGLIYDCRISTVQPEGYRVDIVMTLTAPGCGMGDFLAEDVRDKVAGIPNVAEVKVQLTFDPPWNAEMMSEAARLELGMF